MSGRNVVVVLLLAGLAIPEALAAPAGAETVVYECKVSQSTVAGKKTVYDDAARARPDLRLRFAFNVPAGRGCLLAGSECDQKVGRLAVQQDDFSIVGKSANQELQLTYIFLHHSYVLMNGDDFSASNYEDCETVPLTVTLP